LEENNLPRTRICHRWYRNDHCTSYLWKFCKRQR